MPVRASPWADFELQVHRVLDGGDLCLAVIAIPPGDDCAGVHRLLVAAVERHAGGVEVWYASGARPHPALPRDPYSRVVASGTGFSCLQRRKATPPYTRRVETGTNLDIESRRA